MVKVCKKIKGSGTSRRGFSLLELLVVVAIAALIVAISVTPVMRTVGAFHVRSAMAGLSVLIQNVRMRSVRDDAIYSMISTVQSGSTFYCAADQTGTCISGEEYVQLPSGVVVIPESQAPAAVPVSGYTQDSTDPVSFNARGLPCVAVSATSCNTLPGGTQVGFVYYVLGQPPLGDPIYRAVTVTPAGRVRIWSYSGGAWQ